MKEIQFHIILPTVAFVSTNVNMEKGANNTLVLL